MQKAKLEILPAYHRPMRWAFWCQIAGIILGSMVLDFGFFWFRYLCITLVFWIIVGVLSFTRAHPTIPERIVIATGPQFIFWFMFMEPWR